MPAVWVFPSVITPHGGLVRGRVFKSNPDRGSRIFVRNARSLVWARELPGAHVRLLVGGRVLDAVADGEGFFGAHLEPRQGPLDLGPTPVLAFVESFGAIPLPAGRGHVVVVPEEGVSIVSDFDDTLAVSDVRHKTKLMWNALFRNETGHAVVPGMAGLFRALGAPPARAFHYVSGTPWGLLRRTERFLANHGFPRGALVLRHLETEPFDALAFKPPHILAIAESLPRHRLVLVGDSGEKDPEVFAAVRERLGDRVLATFVRLVTPEPPDAPRFRGTLPFTDAEEALVHARQLGLAG